MATADMDTTDIFKQEKFWLLGFSASEPMQSFFGKGKGFWKKDLRAKCPKHMKDTFCLEREYFLARP